MKVGILSDTHGYLDPKVLNTLPRAMKYGMPVTLAARTSSYNCSVLNHW